MINNALLYVAVRNMQQAAEQQRKAAEARRDREIERNAKKDRYGR